MAEGRTKWPPVKDDWFVEPPAATEFLLAREHFEGPIIDPCCGQGNIVEACRAHGLAAWGSDIKHRPGTDWWMGIWDFRYLRLGPGLPPNIVSNPPYGRAKLTEHFIRHFWGQERLCKLAVFTNAKFLFSQRRAAGLFTEMPPARVWPVLPRPSCPPGTFLAAGGKADGGVENFVWMVWDRFASGPTQLMLGASIDTIRER